MKHSDGPRAAQIGERRTGAAAIVDERPSAAVVPVVEERVALGTQTREVDRVRVTTRTETHEAEVDAVVAREHIEVERVPVGRYVDHAPTPRVEGDTVVIPVLEEVVVLQTRLLLKEEVRVRKRREEEPRRVRVPLRRQHVSIEHVPKPR